MLTVFRCFVYCFFRRRKVKDLRGRSIQVLLRLRIGLGLNLVIDGMVLVGLRIL